MKHHLAFLIAAIVALAAPPEDSRVQAFIPMLNPARQVAVVYPESATPDLRGMVQVLITFDLAGKVIQAEALSGRSELRQAAIDAVRQWSYRPVTRNGKPVYAMTTAMVDVAPACVPGTPCISSTSKLDPAEAAAAFRRIGAIQQQWPRTPSIVLADFEQQSAGDSGVERFQELARLAKAAVEAGALDKAAAYAVELLRMAPQYPQHWNYGNAIHDGNMVLGRVALRKGDAAGARQYLLEAGKTSGSPQLNSFGPNMSLAKELIDANERDSVLRYFELCRSFWKMGGKQLDGWTAMVRGGGKPDFGPNLAY